MFTTARNGGHMDFFVGIDVSKFKHSMAIIDENGVVIKCFDIANSREGFDLILNELGLLGPKEQIKIGMEATGHYMVCLVRCLISNGYQVQVYNPILISKFRESESVNLAKNDKIDSLLIARYVSMHKFAASPQLSYLIEELRKITRVKYFLMSDKTRAINHLTRYLDESFPEFLPFFDKKEDGSKASRGKNLLDSKTIRWLLSSYPSAKKIAKLRIETGELLRGMSKGSISIGKFQQLREIAKKSIGTSSESDEQIIRILITQIETIDKQIEVLNEKIKPLMEQINSPIVSIPGIGINLAAMIIAEIGDINRFDSADKLVKYAGLDVKIYESGTISRRGKIRKRGSPILRYALTLSIQKLRIHCPVIAEYYYSKLREGKHTNVAIVATARKLLRIIWKMMITNQVFDNLKRN